MSRMLNDYVMKTKVPFVYPKNIHIVCSKCGLCCGDTEKRTRHVLLLQSDVDRIVAHTKRPFGSFASEIVAAEQFKYEMKKDEGNGKCIFLSNNECSIYLQRPLICRFYPFELKANELGISEFKASDECPGLCSDEAQRSKKLGTSFFRELLRLAQEEFQPSSC